MAVNTVTLSGYIATEPELRQTASGSAVLNFSLNVPERRKDQASSEWKSYPNFFNCTMFGPRAEGINKIITRNTKVCIEGKLRWSQWEKDGAKRSKVEVLIDEIDLLASTKQNDDVDIPF